MADLKKDLFPLFLFSHFMTYLENEEDPCFGELTQSRDRQSLLRYATSQLGKIPSCSEEMLYIDDILRFWRCLAILVGVEKKKSFYKACCLNQNEKILLLA